MRRNWSAASSVANQLRRSGPVSSPGGVVFVVSGWLVLVLTSFSSAGCGFLKRLIVDPHHGSEDRISHARY